MAPRQVGKPGGLAIDLADDGSCEGRSRATGPPSGRLSAGCRCRRPAVRQSARRRGRGPAAAGASVNSTRTCSLRPPPVRRGGFPSRKCAYVGSASDARPGSRRPRSAHRNGAGVAVGPVACRRRRASTASPRPNTRAPSAEPCRPTVSHPIHLTRGRRGGSCTTRHCHRGDPLFRHNRRQQQPHIPERPV